MALLYESAGRLTAKNGGSRALVPPLVWSTVYLLLQKVTSPRFTILIFGAGSEGDCDATFLALAERRGRSPGRACH